MSTPTRSKRLPRGSVLMPKEAYLPGKREVTQEILDYERAIIGERTFLLPGDVVWDSTGMRAVVVTAEVCQGMSQYALWRYIGGHTAWHSLDTGYSYEKRELHSMWVEKPKNKITCGDELQIISAEKLDVMLVVGEVERSLGRYIKPNEVSADQQLSSKTLNEHLGEPVVCGYNDTNRRIFSVVDANGVSREFPYWCIEQRKY